MVPFLRLLCTMYLKSLQLVNFKNCASATYEFHDGVNCLVGRNGAGKTNVLDAIYYLSFCKSYFNLVDTQNIRHEEPFFVIQGSFEVDNSESAVYCGMKRGQKKVFKREGKEYQKLSEHIGRFPVVIISPYDKDLVYEGSDVRRKFIDGIISQFNPVYLEKLIHYNKALTQRNSLLKYFWENRTFDAESLEIWNMQLADSGAYIFEARQDFIEQFVPVFQKFHQKISGGNEQVSLGYESQLSEHPFELLFTRHLDIDRQRQFTTAGVHKDDLIFEIGGHPLKKFGSQGQQKTFLIALRLAQFEFIGQMKSMKPILLLDDVFDKIDDQRVRSLMELVSENTFGQIFVTDTDAQRVPSIFEAISAKGKVFNLTNGECIHEKTR
jgi:DNA replication and repair protein RecF